MAIRTGSNRTTPQDAIGGTLLYHDRVLSTSSYRIRHRRERSGNLSSTKRTPCCLDRTEWIGRYLLSSWLLCCQGVSRMRGDSASDRVAKRAGESDCKISSRARDNT